MHPDDDEDPAGERETKPYDKLLPDPVIGWCPILGVVANRRVFDGEYWERKLGCGINGKAWSWANLGGKRGGDKNKDLAGILNIGHGKY